MELRQPSSKNQALLDAQLELWHHTLCYIKSMALKSAIDLRIADAIHDHGGTATLPQIATKIMLHQSKLPCLRRLMRVLTVTGVFSIIEHPTDGGGEHVYGLTPASSLLVSSTSMNLSPFMTLMLHSVTLSPFLCLSEWFLHELPDSTVFEMAHGQNFWEVAGHDAKYAKLFGDGMITDSSFNMDIVVKECGDVFHGISSLMDVAGGAGGASQAISKAFPHVKCIVLDLPHVVAAAPAGTDVDYIAGDMFESIPPANAVLLKWVLHDWGDAECVKILRNCKKAIPPRDAGGKVIILEMVVGAGTSESEVKHRETQVLFDLFIMFINGTERDEQGWKKIIFEAGFSDYKIIPVLGVRSIIEVYP
ncbi:hypothetical protein PR202_ga05663 [Eleusine coracana subsp. coracana]|uniref:O-methyltransferase ZRP4 n=1 Tax=Eleusine coracana subsp. coracana TaxID=191504 RepID=A0AAV5BV99_ELECO|nr:hypothetical protein QOZ80_5AG0366680 [Eleusine coracana subsp. coracana]GJM89067.1 hypothetical protein PR202_ga05209 [Eleusine coracana subsp. coracana]GJM89468.1 hypothetical protein PR202_ga05663 [Eleusine coracana subsp. coracana]